MAAEKDLEGAFRLEEVFFKSLDVSNIRRLILLGRSRTCWFREDSGPRFTLFNLTGVMGSPRKVTLLTGRGGRNTA